MNIRPVFDILKNFFGRTNVIATIILGIVIWFVTPAISLHGSHPFASQSTRLLLIGLVLLAWVLKFVIQFLKEHKENAWPIIKEKFAKTGHFLKHGSLNAWHFSRNKSGQFKARLKEDRHRRQLRKRPWYLVLGTPQSGKRTMIANAGFYFQKPEHVGEEAVNYINQFPDCDWWFSDQAVFVDSMTYNKENDSTVWHNFLKLLKRDRKNKPLNGVVLTLSLSEILLYSHQERQDFVQNITQYIRDIHAKFKAQVPVYIIFTKCDLVEGFMEFFNDLSKEELNQVWGVSFPMKEGTDAAAINRIFSKEYGDIVTRLRKRVLWSLDTERTLHGRELIHAFPQQMQLLKKPLTNFIAELFAATRYRNALQLRGLYFTSSKQEGKPNDFLLQAMSKKFQLVSPNIERPKRMGECYFLRRLFSDVILPEAPLLGDSERSKRLRTWGFRAVKIAAPAAIIIGTTGMYKGYKENLRNLKQVNQYITDFTISENRLKAGDSLTALLPLLNPLNAANNLYKHSPDYSLNFLYESGAISDTIDDTLQRTLHSLYLPRVAGKLEAHLNQNIQDQNLLYATLKGYLAFSDSNYTQPMAVLAPMEYSWDKTYINQPHTATQLKYYLKYALKQPIAKLPLDYSLINRRRGELEAIIPSDRAYGLLTLRASVGDMPAINLASATGGQFKRVFVAKEKHLEIPALYTRKGFDHIFLAQYQTIANEVANDNRDIGLSHYDDETQSSGQIESVMEKRYTENYVKQWDQSLENINIVKFHNMDQAIDVLNLLLSKNSPMPHLMAVVYDNTYGIRHDDVNVRTQFAGINGFSESNGSQLRWNQAEKTLTKLRDYLVKLNKSADHDQAYFNAAKAAMTGQDSPIQTLTVEANNAPAPASKWLHQIANNAWDIVIQGAHREINAAWNNDVMGSYTDNLSGRYPLVASSGSQVAIKDFNSFFGGSGTLETFFNQYLKPFVNTDATTWKAYSVNGHSIEIPESHIALFQRASNIRQSFFGGSGKQANLSLVVRPSTLSSRATSTQFIIGNHYINYSHGPRNNTALNWPMPLNAQQSQLIITGFNGAHHARSVNGPWGFFRILQDGHLTRTGSNGRYLFNVNLEGYHASFIINGTSNINTLRLSDLKGFALPHDIATMAEDKLKNS